MVLKGNRVGLLSLGCKVNSCESEQIRELLVEADEVTVARGVVRRILDFVGQNVI